MISVFHFAYHHAAGRSHLKRSPTGGVGELGGIGTRNQERRASDIGVRGDEVVGESRVKGLDALEVFNLLLGKLDAEGLDVVLQVLDLTAADHREDIASLGHNIGQGDGGDGFGAVLGCHLRQSLAGLDLFLVLGGGLAAESTQTFSGRLAALELGLGLELALTVNAPANCDSC